ncbi:MAG: ATP binding [Pleopsidium flavum]|nr:MAG: ATP binding [Pleopsidium flavum]
MAGDKKKARQKIFPTQRLPKLKKLLWPLTPRPSVNNFNGDNLLECDQTVLKDMGVKKIGDRVRIFIAIKQLRTKALGNLKKRNRDSFAALDNNQAYTPSSSGSPRAMNYARERSQPTPPANRRYSRQVDPAALQNYVASNGAPRPSSPLVESPGRNLRAQRYGGMSPMESLRREQGQGYFSHPSSANPTSGRQPTTPGEISQSARGPTHLRQNPSIDGLTMGKFPPKSPIIRVIYSGGQTKVLNIKNCKTADEIILHVLKKMQLPENFVKNYCFYILDGMEANPANCRRLFDAELVRICGDLTRAERYRLILRKIHAGEPDDDELRKAAQIAMEEHHETHEKAVANNNTRSQLKVQKVMGEPWAAVKYPLSPVNVQPPPRIVPAHERQRNVNYAALDLERPESPGVTRGTTSKIKQFFGQRPPSEMIANELTTYFPGYQKEDIEKTVRMSMRRSARLSRAASRLSVGSNISFSSSLKDAPPIPSIADQWLTGNNQPTRGSRPLSISSKFALPPTAYRDSIASTSLQPLQEESPVEPNRKSYVSFGGESGSESAAVAVVDPDGSIAPQSYFDDGGSSGQATEASGSLNQRFSQAIAEDGEDSDEELDQFLKSDSFANIKYMKGELIGQGSFGSVYLALHAITGELMAVKQVELPSNTDSDLDKKKNTMVAVLKHEIDLLRNLQHPNIVQYLGSNSDDEHLNIFLEYVPGGSVAGMLNLYGQLPEPLIRNFVRQILSGLSYLHGRDIIHRDIKGANVLVDNKGAIKISDFGISKRVEASILQPAAKGGHVHRPSLQGSVFWMAPEVVQQKTYTRKADIWSLGCLVVEMFTGTHPFPNFTQLQALYQIGNVQARPTTPEQCSPEAEYFLKQTFEIEEEKRPSADELLLSPFLKPIA